jgi:hypothetical protein
MATGPFSHGAGEIAENGTFELLSGPCKSLSNLQKALRFDLYQGEN